MYKFVLASGNTHKAEEFSELFSKEVVQVEAADSKVDVVEDGATFHENALRKAEGYYNKFQKPVVSDDSGICVDTLPEELGICSARFGGDGLSDKDRAMLLIKKLKESENRNAYFVCVLCFYLSPKEIYFFEGRVNGEISMEYRGDQGFGYDPVFSPDALNGETFAENPDWKALNSHRAKAVAEAQKFFAAQKK